MTRERLALWTVFLLNQAGWFLYYFADRSWLWVVLAASVGVCAYALTRSWFDRNPDQG